MKNLTPFYFGQLNLAPSAIAVGGAPTTPINFPKIRQGNMLLRELRLRFNGSLNLTTSSAGSVITDGEKIAIADIQLIGASGKHGIITKGIDALTWDRMNRLMFGCFPVASSVSAATTGTPTFNNEIVIPLALFFGNMGEGRRPNDTILDLFNEGMDLNIQVGDPGKFISGGTYTTETISPWVVDVWGDVVLAPDIDPSNINASDLPTWQHMFEIIKPSPASTDPAFPVTLPSGDRRKILRIWIFQRNSSTLAEITSIIPATGLIGIQANGQPLYIPTPFQVIQDQNKREFGVESMVSNGIVLDFFKDKSLLRALDVSGYSQGTVTLNIGVNSGSNQQLYIVVESVKQPFPDAERAEVLAWRQTLLAPKKTA